MKRGGILKLLKTIKSCIVFLLIMAFFSGCLTLDESHNYEHKRAVSKDVGLMHKDFDSFLGTSEPSMLRER